jgi:hypothetical protein
VGEGRYALTDDELASQLSYLFWGSMPDDELFAQASAGALHTPEQIAAQARRLLASPRSRAVLDHFVGQWLEVDQVLLAAKDPQTFPDFNPALQAAMRAETAELFDYVIRSGSGRLPELFSARYTFLTDELAAFYGLTGPAGEATASGLRRWELHGSGRGGILSHGSILTSQATPQSSSPVRRGKLVRERLLCQPLPPPPPGFEVPLPPVDPQQSNRQRFLEHSQNVACASCHQLMDPIGFGFEHFDSIGRYQPTQGGQPVDATGEVRASPSSDGVFTGVDGLQEKLAASVDVQACFSLQWLRFAYGVSDAPCLAQQLTERFQQGGLSIPELLVSLTQLPRFTGRQGESLVPPGETPSGDFIQVAVKPDTSWPTGYCNVVTVSNTAPFEVVWLATLGVEGTLSNTWNADATPTTGGQVAFTGKSYNRRLAPGASTSFGYCGKR